MVEKARKHSIMRWDSRTCGATFSIWIFYNYNLYITFIFIYIHGITHLGDFVSRLRKTLVILGVILHK
jgi:hypothetical protein